MKEIRTERKINKEMSSRDRRGSDEKDKKENQRSIKEKEGTLTAEEVVKEVRRQAMRARGEGVAINMVWLAVEEATIQSLATVGTKLASRMGNRRSNGESTNGNGDKRARRNS